MGESNGNPGGSPLVRPRSQSAILQAARQLLATRSYASLTVGELCDAAGVSRPTFYANFSDKKAMMLALCQEALHARLTTVTKASARIKDDFAKIVLANDAYVTVWANDAPILCEYTSLAMYDEDFIRMRADDLGPGEQRIERKLRHLMLSGEIPRRDPRALTVVLSSLAEGFCFRYFSRDRQAFQVVHDFPSIVRLITETWYAAVYFREPPQDYPYHRHRLHPCEDGRQRWRSAMTGEGAATLPEPGEEGYSLYEIEI